MKGTLFVALGFLGCVALLGYYAYPRTVCCYGPKVRTKALLMDVVNAARAYELEYGRLPVDPEIKVDREIVFDGNPEGRAVLGVLAGENLAIGSREFGNPREVVFFEPDISNGRRLGIVYEGDLPVKLLDGWGQPIHLKMDGNSDGEILFPDGSRSERRKMVVAWSDGSPRHEVAEDLWKNNVKTWDY